MRMWRWMAALLIGASASAMLSAAAWHEEPVEDNLVQNANFSEHGSDGLPAYFALGNAARYQFPGDPRRDMSGLGIALRSSGGSGFVTQTVAHFANHAGKGYRFSIYGLPQDTFSVRDDALILKVDFLGTDGVKSFDGKTKSIYPVITQARRDLTVNGVHHVGGAAVWTTYSLDFVIPFAEVDQVRLSVGFENGNGNGDFYICKFSLTPKTTAVAAPAQTTLDQPQPATPEHLIPLGGRWFYLPKEGETAAPTTFDYRNADQLLYHDGRYTAPFAGMMTSILRAGEKDDTGTIATEDRVIDDNVVIRFQPNGSNAGVLIIHSRGLPNHPTGKFPETGVGRGFNPSYIIEQNETFYLPLDPQVNPRHFVTDTHNANHALPMGPIGIAVNGVVFFNPFDMGNTDATDLMDRCCGHPNQDGLYHYHKYPICLNSPWSDGGEGHSPLIGFAFDGFPIYGPYEFAGVMAKDETGEHALNEFNLHFDAERGWHYHVTPGKFPYIISGYWGTEDARDNPRPRHPRGTMMARPPPRS